MYWLESWLEPILKSTLVECFGESKLLSQVSRDDAKAYRHWLKTKKKFADNTAGRHCGRARQFFAEAVEDELIEKNPFRKIPVSVGAGDKHYVDEATILKIVEKGCPDLEWKLLFLFARFVGPRVPSEI